jgi:molybdate transport system ATP-binding protein
MSPERALKAEISVRATRGAEHPFSLDVSIEAPPGVTILFGPSGSGKSTTLAAIAGLVKPDAGRVAVGDDVWFDGDGGIDRAVHHRGLAFVFQSLALFPHMTAADNVAYGIDRHVAADERRRRALAMLERMRVGHLAARKPRTFSGGEAQRVALARAFARSPRVVLLDEPFSALDRELRHELCADVKATVAELGIPAILVTHHRHEARTMGDRIVVLRDGRVTARGDVASHLPAIAGEDT